MLAAQDHPGRRILPGGRVDVFESSHDGEPIYEIGWMILPEFQNQGIAGQAVRKVLEWQPLAGRPVLKPSGSSRPRAATSGAEYLRAQITPISLARPQEIRRLLT